MMPSSIRPVKHYFGLLCGSLFCCICGDSLLDKEVSRKVLFRYRKLTAGLILLSLLSRAYFSGLIHIFLVKESARTGTSLRSIAR
jgi:hypothetical protein